MNHLLAISSPEARLNVINEERHKGSMPMELFLRLKKQEQAGRLMIHHSPIDEINNKTITPMVVIINIIIFTCHWLC